MTTLELVDLLRNMADGARLQPDGEYGPSVVGDNLELAADHVEDLAAKLCAAEDREADMAETLQIVALHLQLSLEEVQAKMVACPVCGRHGCECDPSVPGPPVVGEDE